MYINIFYIFWSNGIIFSPTWKLLKFSGIYLLRWKLVWHPHPPKRGTNRHCNTALLGMASKPAPGGIVDTLWVEITCSPKTMGLWKPLWESWKSWGMWESWDDFSQKHHGKECWHFQYPNIDLSERFFTFSNLINHFIWHFLGSTPPVQ